MIEFSNELLITLVLLSLCVVMAMIRVVRGPTAPDRVVGLDTINTIVIVCMVIFVQYLMKLSISMWLLSMLCSRLSLRCL